MRHIMCLISLLLMLTACNITLDETLLPTRASITIASVTPDLTPQATVTESLYPQGVYDALGSTTGICFEAAWNATGQIFVLRSAEEHIRFYDGVDNSGLCRRPIQREPFDFTTGDVLIGIWNNGTGCTATHDITSFTRDDTAQTIIIEAQFSTQGDCQYDLVRGLWLGITDAQSYIINLIVDD